MMAMGKIEFIGKLRHYYIDSNSGSTMKNIIDMSFRVDISNVAEFAGFLVDTQGKTGIFTFIWKPVEPGDYDHMGSPQSDWRG